MSDTNTNGGPAVEVPLVNGGVALVSRLLRQERKSKCRACADEATTKWKEKNREQYNAYQRAYRAKRKSEGRPVTRSD